MTSATHESDMIRLPELASASRGRRRIRGTRRFLDYGASLPLRRDELQRLESEGELERLSTRFDRRPPPLAHEKAVQIEGLTLRVRSDPYRDQERQAGIWNRLEQSPGMSGLPDRFSVHLPVRMHQIQDTLDGDRPAVPHSIKCRCLLSTLGVGVKIRFGFGPAARADLAQWGRRRPRFFAKVGDRVVWWGEIPNLLWLAVRGVAQACGRGWPVLARPSWSRSLKNGLKKIYTEIAEEDESGEKDPPPNEALLFGLGSFRHGARRVTRGYWKSRSLFVGPDDEKSMREGEMKMFTPEGAGLYLLFTSRLDNSEWLQANCFRRDVAYSVTLHNALVGQLVLLTGARASVGESNAVVNDPTVAEIAAARLQILEELQRRCWWLRHYSRRRRVDERLQALPRPVREKLCDEAVWDGLMRQLRTLPAGEPVTGTEAAEPD